MNEQESSGIGCFVTCCLVIVFAVLFSVDVTCGTNTTFYTAVIAVQKTDDGAKVVVRIDGKLELLVTRDVFGVLAKPKACVAIQRNITRWTHSESDYIVDMITPESIEGEPKCPAVWVEKP